MRQVRIATILVGLALSGHPATAHGAAGAQTEALRVFLDCVRCDDDYLRQQITWLNYVVNREDAQVHVLVTVQPSGGGAEYTFAFIGREGFAGRDDEVRYYSSDTDTSDERREGIAQTLQLGLLPYLAGTSLAGQVEILHEADAGLSPSQPEEDPWNFWRFRLSANANLDTEESQRFFSASGAFSAERTTETWKIRLNGRGDFSTDEFDFGDGESFTNTTTDWNTTMLVVRSLGEHWGIGGGGSVITSTFVNQDRTMRLAPAIEYSVFPYAESTRRQLTFAYAVGANAFDYEGERRCFRGPSWAGVLVSWSETRREPGRPRHLSGGGSPAPTGLDPVSWTLSKRGIRCPRWLTRKASEHDGASRMNSRRGRSGWSSKRARPWRPRPAISI